MQENLPGFRFNQELRMAFGPMRGWVIVDLKALIMLAAWFPQINRDE
jgi:hypothetical protein